MHIRLPWTARTDAGPTVAPAPWLPRIVRDLLACARLWAGRVRENRELARYDDRLLRDMGLTRYDLAQRGPRPTRRS